MKGRHFSSEKEIIAAEETWLEGPCSEFFSSGSQKLDHLAKICIERLGEYVH